MQKLGMWGHGRLGRAYVQTWPTLSSDSRKRAGRRYTKPQSSNRSPGPDYVAAPPVIHPPLKNGWGWSTRASSTQLSGDSMGHNENGQRALSMIMFKSEIDEESDDIDDTNDELLTNDFDSDGSQKRRRSRRTGGLRNFFSV
ncbi:hypothetical protein Salat_0201900 [Sesamum alatum]|uniref:Uncharacterized protein n=1 Tax=Sesamum alatum TaxID=300844 RepID=A0AAE1YY87_9LAMI|nr:hypothetical protein Salat_0201900 [Sesamum alatum]